MMIKFIGLLIAFVWIPQIGKSQPIIDSLLIDELNDIELITDIYDIPHTRYKLDHFVLIRKALHVDPHLQYNKGEKLGKDAKLFLEWFQAGDTLIIKEVYAINSESPGKGLVKLPEKEFLLK